MCARSVGLELYTLPFLPHLARSSRGQRGERRPLRRHRQQAVAAAPRRLEHRGQTTNAAQRRGRRKKRGRTRTLLSRPWQCILSFSSPPRLVSSPLPIPRVPLSPPLLTAAPPSEKTAEAAGRRRGRRPLAFFFSAVLFFFFAVPPDLLGPSLRLRSPRARPPLPRPPPLPLRAAATYVAGGDAKGLGNALVELLHVGEVADLLGGRAVRQLAVEHHVKLLGRHLRAAGRRRDRAALLRHCAGVAGVGVGNVRPGERRKARRRADGSEGGGADQRETRWCGKGTPTIFAWRRQANPR